MYVLKINEQKSIYYILIISYVLFLGCEDHKRSSPNNFLLAEIKQAITKEEDLNQTQKTTKHPPELAYLHTAAIINDTDSIELLLKNGADIHNRDYADRTPLHFAAESGSLGAAKLLIDNGADVEAGSVGNDTPLFYAISAPKNRDEMISLLVGAGASVHSKDDLGRTPLHDTMINGEESIPILLEYGADINAKDGRGNTPLHLAATYGKVKMAKILLKNGADINARDELGDTPLDVIKSGALPGDVNMWNVNKVARILRAHKADE